MPKFFTKLLVYFTCLTFLPISAGAAEFDYNNIISDEQLLDYNSMGQLEIKRFLESKNSYLANYFYYGNNPGPYDLQNNPGQEDYFKNRSAAEIIYNASQEAKVNPKFLLTMLQKEMSLIEDTDPVENQLDFAMGYFCFDGQACNPRWRGFGKQVRSTALQFEDYVKNIHTRTYNPNTTSMIEGIAIRPANAATAGLYNYTPHLHGNELFKTIWDRYGFGIATAPEFTGIIPEGSLVKAKDGEDTETIYLIHNGFKMPFATMSALVSRYDPKRIMSVAADELNKFSTGQTIKYTAYSILQGPDNNKYLLDGLTKRLIASDEVFRSLGFNPEEVVQASSEDLAAIADGPAITTSTAKPTAQLLRTSTGGVFYVKDDTKSPIIHPDIIAINFPDLKIVKASDETLNQLRQVEAVKLNEGTLVMSNEGNQVYVIAGGARRWITNENTFKELGYSWANIVKVDPRVLKLHKVGEPLSL